MMKAGQLATCATQHDAGKDYAAKRGLHIPSNTSTTMLIFAY